jgi:hypothetical protein
MSPVAVSLEDRQKCRDKNIIPYLLFTVNSNVDSFDSPAQRADTGTWSLGAGVGAGTGPDGLDFSADQPGTKRSASRTRSDTVYLSPRRHGRTAAGAVKDTIAGRMRSAAAGEHRTGEECLEGIARGCAILLERWAIGARWNGAGA